MAKNRHDGEHQDEFAAIGFREHPGSGLEMDEIPPIPYNKIFFKPTQAVSDRIKQYTHEEKLQQFQDELKQLRKKYRPFLQMQAPALDFSRKSEELMQFQFRYHEKADNDFNRVLSGAGEWENVTIPDFRGPTHFEGKWTGYYRTEFSYGEVPENKRVFLSFQGVDYIATVYLNNKCIGSHEGFFAPFEFDVTDVLRERNVLVVEVKNDYPMKGVQGTKLDGDKMYAATGLGWDDPIDGWHHCPPGAGIYNKVFLEERAPMFIKDMFVRPNIDENCAEVWVDVYNTADDLVEEFEIEVEIVPKNFKDSGTPKAKFLVEYAGPGMNYYRYRIDLKDYRLWEPETPWLYLARATVYGPEGIDKQESQFGMRKFHMDEEEELKGTLYLNNRSIKLRGTNEMGHLPQCVMKEDFDQLIDDILIAKMANINFYRLTQRPVHKEIYEYMDMLGMMTQTDLPTFGFFRRNQFAEGVRQAAEMERLIRSHASSVMVSLINEPSRAQKRNRGHRYLYRDELEAFFVACRQAIYIENPDRVVKNTDGDYDPPTQEGLPDFHCYNLWYTNNGITVGKMYKGYLPPIKAGWKSGCGEYGTEGLDNYDVMMSSYPKEWLPESPDAPWKPDKIVAAQTYGYHGDWFPEQETIKDWIAASQKHHAFSAKMMTDAWRRRGDMIVSSAIHLLIDAWPSGWMKALVGYDRVPKPAFFAYKESLEPVRVNLRCDRWKAYSRETVELEAWLLNDTSEPIENARIVATLRSDDQDYGSFEINGTVGETTSKYAGTIRCKMPEVTDRKKIYFDACLYNAQGEKINEERFEMEVFARLLPAKADEKIAYVGEEAQQFGDLLQLGGQVFDANAATTPDVFLVSSPRAFDEHADTIVRAVKQGAKAIMIRSNEESYEWTIGDEQVRPGKFKRVYTLAIDREDERLSWMEEDDLAYLYNANSDMIDMISDLQVDGNDIKPLVYGYKKQGDHKLKCPVIGKKDYGHGEFIFSMMPWHGFIGSNPTLDRMFISLAKK